MSEQKEIWEIVNIFDQCKQEVEILETHEIGGLTIGIHKPLEETGQHLYVATEKKYGARVSRECGSIALAIEQAVQNIAKHQNNLMDSFIAAEKKIIEAGIKLRLKQNKE